MENRRLVEGNVNVNANVAGALDVSHDQGPLDFTKRQSVVDDNKFLGQQIPSRLSHGPVRSRRMTDLVCCIIFALFFAGWLAIGIYYTFTSDRLDSLNDMLDSEGNYCGVDAKVKDYPFLFMVKFDANYRSVCVKECPKFDYNQIKYNSTGSNTTIIQPLYYEDLASAVRRPYDIHFDSKVTDESFAYDSRFANGYYTEEQLNAYVNRYQMDCYPNEDVKSCKNNKTDSVFIYDSRPGAMSFCNAVQPNLAGVSARLGKVEGSWVKDIKIAKWMILASVLTAFVCSLIFLFVSRILMDVIIWLQLAIAIVFMVLLSVLLYYVAFTDLTNNLRDNGATPEAIEAYRTAKKYKVVI